MDGVGTRGTSRPNAPLWAAREMLRFRSVEADLVLTPDCRPGLLRAMGATADQADAWNREIGDMLVAGTAELDHRFGSAGAALGQQVGTIVGIGDSNMADRAGWFEVISAWAGTANDSVTFVNQAVSGDSSTHAIARLPRLINMSDVSTVVIALGTNDARRVQPDAPCLVSVGEFERNLDQIVAIVESVGAEAILVTPPPVSEELVGSEPFGTRERWSNGDIDERAHVVRTLGERRGLKVVDLNAACSPLSGAHLSADGIHFSQLGHHLAAMSVVKQFVTAGTPHPASPTPENDRAKGPR